MASDELTIMTVTISGTPAGRRKLLDKLDDAVVRVLMDEEPPGVTGVQTTAVKQKPAMS
jgi:hypothetical protein